MLDFEDFDQAWILRFCPTSVETVEVSLRAFHPFTVYWSRVNEIAKYANVCYLRPPLQVDLLLLESRKQSRFTQVGIMWVRNKTDTNGLKCQQLDRMMCGWEQNIATPPRCVSPMQVGCACKQVIFGYFAQ